jgi:hypothetical protein
MKLELRLVNRFFLSNSTTENYCVNNNCYVTGNFRMCNMCYQKRFNNLLLKCTILHKLDKLLWSSIKIYGEFLWSSVETLWSSICQFYMEKSYEDFYGFFHYREFSCALPKHKKISYFATWNFNIKVLKFLKQLIVLRNSLLQCTSIKYSKIATFFNLDCLRIKCFAMNLNMFCQYVFY